MSDSPQTQPPGWYYAQGDPPGTQRYWDGAKWEGSPQPVPGLGGDVGAPGGGSDLGEPALRIGARLIDWILWFIVSVVVNAIFGINSFDLNSLNDAGYGAVVAAGVLTTVAIVAYEALLVANNGQTLGKMALNLKVVKPDRSPVELQGAVMRIGPYALINVLGSIIPFLALIAFPAVLIVGIVSTVFLFTDAQRQAVWDKIASTIVVSTK